MEAMPHNRHNVVQQQQGHMTLVILYNNIAWPVWHYNGCKGYDRGRATYIALAR